MHIQIFDPPRRVGRRNQKTVAADGRAIQGQTFGQIAGRAVDPRAVQTVRGAEFYVFRRSVALIKILVETHPPRNGHTIVRHIKRFGDTADDVRQYPLAVNADAL